VFSSCVFPQNILTRKGWAGGHRAAFFSIVIALLDVYTHLKSDDSAEKKKIFSFIGFVQRTPCNSKKAFKGATPG
jgi:hypothetical protein